MKNCIKILVIISLIFFQVMTSACASDMGVENEEVLQSGNESLEEKTEIEDIQSEDNAEEKEFTYMADLTHDGTEETVNIDISDISKDNQLAANIYVNNANGSTIWKQEAYIPSAGWTSYYLCNINGEDYLLYYMPSTGQGIGHYEYKLFYLDNEGTELIILENEISFDAYPFSEEINFPVDDMVSFANEVNQYLNQGYMLLSTWEGILQYSTPDEKIIHLESYENLDYPTSKTKPEDLRERLNQYKEYLNKIWIEMNSNNR